MSTAYGLVLSTDELQQLTRYRQPAAQLRELHRQGFWRARRSTATGAVILERAHYEAICADAQSSKRSRRQPPEPQLSPA